jgi:hypothetical protein
VIRVRVGLNLVDDVTRRASHGANNGAVDASEPVEQRRLTHVRLAEDGDGEWLLALLELVGRAEGLDDLVRVRVRVGLGLGFGVRVRVGVGVGVSKGLGDLVHEIAHARAVDTTHLVGGWSRSGASDPKGWLTDVCVGGSFGGAAGGSLGVCLYCDAGRRQTIAGQHGGLADCGLRGAVTHRKLAALLWHRVNHRHAQWEVGVLLLAVRVRGDNQVTWSMGVLLLAVRSYLRTDLASRACSPTCSRLQPRVLEAAALSRVCGAHRYGVAEAEAYYLLLTTEY